MKKEDISLLLGYFSSQEEEIERLYQEIKTIEPIDKEKTICLAYYLHNLYCAFEDLFKEITRTFENKIEDISSFHKELLKRMFIEVPGIRPRVLSRESFLLLDELRGFRHIFRHMYTYELSPEKIKDLKDKLVRNWDTIKRDFDGFKNWLKLNL